MAKRARLSSSFNPVYPYEDESSSQHPFINPGFISPDGFTQNSDGVLTLKCTAPLTTTGGSLQLKVGRGLTVDTTDGTLEEDIHILAPLTKTAHSIGLSLGNGLELKDSKLYVKLGDGLKFNSNSICLDHDINTLWTGMNPSINCNIMQQDDNDSKLTLVLTKNGGMVNAYVSLVGASDIVNSLFTRATANITIRLSFDASGNLLTSLSDLKTPLNHRYGNDMDTVTLTNGKSFMPSTTAYPFNDTTRDKENYIYGTCYYKSTEDALYPLEVAVTLNRRMSSAAVSYAMTIAWTLSANTPPETTIATLVTSPFTFSYIREND